ncbi:hypothetical protein RI844_20175 [Thalassotalea fonticola]|uniref:Uncharacterized protein n=1 Tax=Thalassotalea fonticola TaxID=3065649 RepID=A0ABZ0GQK4_9GAMM|nr:hypothetical protein RI844_20175 [Colwelliaceae bacterium S1-1]
MKLFLTILALLFSSHAYSDVWEALSSKDKSLNKTIYTSKHFTVDEGRIKIRSGSFPKCNSDYGIKYGVLSLNNTNIKLKFTCSEGRYPTENFEIATKEGMKFTLGFLKSNKKFTFQITTPTVVRGENQVTFDKALGEVIKEPRTIHVLNQSTKGSWYSTGEKGQYVLIEDMKNQRKNLLGLHYDEIKSEVTLKLNFRSAYWTDRYPSIYGKQMGHIGECNYLTNNEQSGVLYINGKPLELSLKCENYNNIISLPDSNVTYVPSVGQLKVGELIISLSDIKNLTEIKKIKIHFELKSLSKEAFSKSITLHRSINETIALIDAQNNKKKKALKAKKDSIKRQVNNSM